MAVFSILAALQVLRFIAMPYAKNASGHGSDEVNCDEDVEGQPPKGAEADIDPTTRQSCPEVHEYHHAQIETSCGGEDERPIVHMLQNLSEEVSQYHDHTNNNLSDQVLQQQDFSTATTSAPEIPEVNTIINIHSESDEQGVSREERNDGIEAEEEEMKRASKFVYFITSISVAGIMSIYSGYLENQTEHANNTVPLKVCTFFMLATFISGVSMLFLTWRRRSYRISIEIFRRLKYTALVFLSLAMFDVSFLFLKTLAILAVVPTLFIAMIASYMAEVHCLSYFC